jgi:hypothetical protein
LQEDGIVFITRKLEVLSATLISVFIEAWADSRIFKCE